jgi:hypothetical protein
MAAKDTESKNLKEMLHPGLLYLLSVVIGYMVTTTNSDVKTLVAQSNVDKTEIATLKGEVAQLQSAVFYVKPKLTLSPVSNAPNNNLVYCVVLNKHFKHEEELTFNSPPVRL